MPPPSCNMGKLSVIWLHQVRIGFLTTKTLDISIKLKWAVCHGVLFTGNFGFAPNMLIRQCHLLKTKAIQDQGSPQFPQVSVLNSIVVSFVRVIAVFTICVLNARMHTTMLNVLFVPSPIKTSSPTCPAKFTSNTSKSPTSR